MRIVIEDTPAAGSAPVSGFAPAPESEPAAHILDGGAAPGSSPGSGGDGATGDDVGAPPAWLLDAVNAAMAAATGPSGDAPSAPAAESAAADATAGDIGDQGEDAGAGPA